MSTNIDYHLMNIKRLLGASNSHRDSPRTTQYIDSKYPCNFLIKNAIISPRINEYGIRYTLLIVFNVNKNNGANKSVPTLLILKFYNPAPIYVTNSFGIRERMGCACPNACAFSQAS